MQPIQVHVFVSGEVQGVGYRYFTQQFATRVGLAGWVRNLPDGRVEAVFEGTPEQVESLLRWCHQGPPAARVTDVAVEYTEPQGLETFQIKR